MPLEFPSVWKYLKYDANIPTKINTILAIYADITAILSTDNDTHLTAALLQNNLDSLEDRLNYWPIILNRTNSVQVKFIIGKTVQVTQSIILSYLSPLKLNSWVHNWTLRLHVNPI